MKRTVYNIVRFGVLAVWLMLTMASAVAQTNTVSAGQQSSLGIDPIAGATYVWDLYIDDVTVNFAIVSGNCPIGDAYFVGGNTSSTVNVMWETPGTYYFRVKVIGPDGCQNLKLGQMEVIDCPPPAVFFLPCFDAVTSVEGRPFRLKGGLPLNGVYSGGPWVNSTTGMFNPQAAPTGPVPVTYTYTNAAGCSASAQATVQNNPAPLFNCGSPFTDPRDNKVYPTVLLGTQCWLGSNLNYGAQIPYEQVQTENCAVEKYCYNNSSGNCDGPGAQGLQDGPGGLYQWDELMQYSNTQGTQDLCPPGWHVPTAAEWDLLFAVYGGYAFAGTPLQDMAMQPGFHALLTGVVYQNEIWSFKDLATILWSSTPVVPNKAVSRGLNNIDPSVSFYESTKAHAFPVRCTRN